MSGRRAKTTGWAAFDLQQRQKDLEYQGSNEPFPSLPSTMTSVQPSETFSRKNQPSMKPFSSVIRPYVNFAAADRITEPAEVGNSVGSKNSDNSQDQKHGLVFSQLKELYSWADDGLIEDIIAASDNDFGMASEFLKAMVSDKSSENNKDDMVVYSGCDGDKKSLCGRRDVSSGEISEPSKACSVLDSLGGDNGNERNEFDGPHKKFESGFMDMNSLLGHLRCGPIEPEWEEDDVYLSCRKDAIKMMRNAARHSKAASNSFLRGDHFFAQQFSLKAREDWAVAQRLNEKAAHEILRIRNENNGMWRLDLHGLHAAEAVQALQERLYMIETQLYFKGASSSGLPKAETLHASSSGHYNVVERSDEQKVYGPKPIWLEVITGVGNHSRGGAALPIAVRSFLVDNGYRFDEARPGIVVVRPKIRHN